MSDFGLLNKEKLRYSVKSELNELDCTFKNNNIPFWGISYIDSFANMYTPSFYLDLGNICNQSCLYCGVPKDEKLWTSKKLLMKYIDNAKRLGIRKAVLIGGEPTIRNDCIEIVRYLKNEGFEKIILTTNGLVLSYRDYLEKFINSGVSSIHLSLDSFNKKVIKKLSNNVKSPDLIMNTIENILSFSQIESFFYCVVTKINSDDLIDYINNIKEIDKISHRNHLVIFCALRPVERALQNSKDVLLKITKGAERTSNAIKYGIDLKVNVAYKGFPPCLMKGFEGYNLDLYLNERRISIKNGKELKGLGEKSFKKPVQCNKCAFENLCTGIHKNYLDIFGNSDIFPVEK